MNDNVQKEMRDYAWKYFSLHADQRLRVFNFYVVLATVLAGALLTILKDATNHLVGVPLAFLLAFLSFIFWKLDHRTKVLVRHGENALKVIEAHFPVPDDNQYPNQVRILLREEFETSQRKRFPKCLPLRGDFSYSDCFNWVFFLFGCGGVILGILLFVCGR